MTNRSLYLVRHGHRLDEIDKKWYEKDGLNKYDPPLSDEGKEQAQKLAQRLQQEHIDMIFTSPYWRAIQTAHPIADCLDLPLYVENGVGEWLGKAMIPHEPNIIPAFQRRDEFPMLEFSHNPRVIPHYPETAQQCFDRLENTMTQLLDTYEGNLLIVGHGRTVTGLAHRLVGKPESNFKLNNAGITKLDYDNGKWICRLNSDDTHLTSEVMPQFI